MLHSKDLTYINDGYIKAYSKEQFKEALNKIIPSTLSTEDVIFVCIGTDRSTGDSLGPLVGTFLETLGYKNVIGTLENPLHAKNLTERLSTIPTHKKIIAIDSSLGALKDVQSFSVIKGSIKPGEAVNKKLEPIGDYSILGIVNMGGFMNHLVLQNTRLWNVMEMATVIANNLNDFFPLDFKKMLLDIKK